MTDSPPKEAEPVVSPQRCCHTAKQPDDAASSVCASQTRSQRAAFNRNRESLQDLIFRKLTTKHQAKVVNPDHICPFQDFIRAMILKFT